MQINTQIILKESIQYLSKNSNYEILEIRNLVFWLLEFYFQLKKTNLLSEQSIEVESLDYHQFNLALQRLTKNEPIQYIIGETEFYGRKFKVNPSVLIPRPETEELVEWIIKDFKNNSNKIKILDIGTGSGCIPISLALEIPHSQVFSIDISQEALQVAQENAQLNQAKVNFMEADILQATDYELLTKDYQIIVSNPPYVTEAEKRQMHKNVLDFEPELALFVLNENPLVFYQKITQFAHNQLVEGGNLYFEINENFGKEMFQLLENEGFINIELRKDLRGKDRMIKAVNKGQ